jgi:two-component system, LytTR family, response regulator
MEHKIKAVIAEDVKQFHDVIETFLAEVAPQVSIVGKATTLAETKVFIEKFSPQLLFLDIQFDAEGRTAFDFLKELEERGKIGFQIIIITAFNQAAYYDEAFKYGAMHYLTKPIDKEKLKQAINRVSKILEQSSENELLSQFIQKYSRIQSSANRNKMVIEGLSYTEIVSLENIVYIEAFGSYSNIYLMNSPEQVICSSTCIGDYEAKLVDNPDFFRIHRSVIVNSNYVLRLSKKDRSLVLPEPFPKLQASKEKLKEFIQFLDNEED